MNISSDARTYLEKLQKRALDEAGIDSEAVKITDQQRDKVLKQALLDLQIPSDETELWKNELHTTHSFELPTLYSEPEFHWIVEQRVKSIEKAAAEHGDNLPANLIFSTIPNGELNARVIRIPTGDILVLMNRGLMTFLYLLAKVFAMATPLRPNTEDFVVFETNKERVLENLNQQPDIEEHFRNLLYAYVVQGELGAARRYSIKPPHLQHAIAITQPAQLFVVGHEYGHLIAGHLEPGIKGIPTQGDDKQEEIFYNHEKEFAADAIGLGLTNLALRSEKGHLMPSVVGPILFLVAMELVHRARSILETSNEEPVPSTESHPSPIRRLEVLKLGLSEVGQEGSVKMSGHYEQVLWTLWDRNRSFFEKMHSYGIRTGFSFRARRSMQY